MRPYPGTIFETLHALKMKKLKGVVLSTPESAAFYNNHFGDAGLFRPSKKSIVATSYTMYFKRHSFLVGLFDKHLDRFSAAGHLAHWSKPYLYDYPKIASDRHPQILRLAHIEGIFPILLGILFISLFVFLLEKLSTRFRFIRRIMDNL